MCIRDRLTIGIERLTKTGVESAIWTLGHEAAHSRGIDRNMPSSSFHSNAEELGRQALLRYRANRDGNGG